MAAGFVYRLQDEIIAALKVLDPASHFQEDAWHALEAACVFSSPTSSTILEKPGVDISLIHGTLPPQQ